MAGSDAWIGLRRDLLLLVLCMPTRWCSWTQAMETEERLFDPRLSSLSQSLWNQQLLQPPLPQFDLPPHTHHSVESLRLLQNTKNQNCGKHENSSEIKNFTAPLPNASDSDEDKDDDVQHLHLPVFGFSPEQEGTLAFLFPLLSITTLAVWIFRIANNGAHLCCCQEEEDDDVEVEGHHSNNAAASATITPRRSNRCKDREIPHVISNIETWSAVTATTSAAASTKEKKKKKKSQYLQPKKSPSLGMIVTSHATTETTTTMTQSLCSVSSSSLFTWPTIRRGGVMDQDHPCNEIEDKSTMNENESNVVDNADTDGTDDESGIFASLYGRLSSSTAGIAVAKNESGVGSSTPVQRQALDPPASSSSDYVRMLV